MYNQFIVEGRFLRKAQCYIYQKGITSKASMAQARVLSVSMKNEGNGQYYNRTEWIPLVFWREFADIANDLLIDNGIYVFEGIIKYFTTPFRFNADNKRLIYGTTLICQKVYASTRKETSAEVKRSHGLLLYKTAPRKKTTRSFDLTQDKDLEMIGRQPLALTETRKQRLVNAKFKSMDIQTVDMQKEEQQQPQTTIHEPQQSYRTNYDPEDF